MLGGCKLQQWWVSVLRSSLCWNWSVNHIVRSCKVNIHRNARVMFKSFYDFALYFAWCRLFFRFMMFCNMFHVSCSSEAKWGEYFAAMEAGQKAEPPAMGSSLRSAPQILAIFGIGSCHDCHDCNASVRISVITVDYRGTRMKYAISVGWL